MLTADDRRRVLDLFGVCIDLNPGRRDEFYRETNISIEIREEVERLIRNHRSGTESLFRPPGAARALLREIPPLFSSGDRIAGRFSVIEFIERGGMGEVYRAQTPSGEIVALKVIRPLNGVTEENIRRFRREFQSQSQIDHPNVCRVFESLQHETPGGTVDFFTMQFVEGKTLAAVLRSQGRLTQQEAVEIASGVLAGLEAAHSRGIIHRDLKPSNIMLADGAGPHRALLLDFGLARWSRGVKLETSLTQTGQAFGTFDYMSPEQLQGQRADARSDLYAFGLIVFEMLTGTHPFRCSASETLPVLDRRKCAVPRIPADLGPIDKRWIDVIDVCLQPDPADRAASAGAVIDVLEGRAPRHWIRVPRRIRRRAAIGAIAATAAGAGIVYWEQRQLHFARGVAVLLAENSANDPPTDKAVTLQFRNLLNRSEFVTVWDPANLPAVWNRMGRAASSSPSDRDWREIAFREHVGLVVFLSLAKGAVNLRVEQVEGSPEKAWREWTKRFPVESEEQILTALESAGKWLRGLAGESIAEIANTSSVEAVTTPSWRALKEFSRGEQLATERRLEDALLAYSAALRLDSDFTMAWMRTGDINMSLGRDKDAFTAWKRAVDSAARRPLSRREDLKFRSMLASDAGDYEAAEKLFAEYFHYFPDDWFGLYYREFPLMMLGRVEEALAMLEKTLAFPDRRGRAHMKLCWALLYKGDIDHAREHAAELTRMNLPTLAGWANAAIYYIEENADAALAALSEAAKDAQLVPTTIHEVYKCNVLADAGRTEEAIRRCFDSAEEDLRQGRMDERAAKLIGGAALLAQTGNSRECVRRLVAIDVSTLGPRRLADLVMLLARNQALDRAKEVSQKLRIDLPYPRFQIARLRSDGEIALASGKLRSGLERMTTAANLDSRAYGKQYLAYAQERSGDRAAARLEYQQHLRAKPFQIHQLTPEPAGSWRRSLEALKRLT